MPLVLARDLWRSLRAARWAFALERFDDFILLLPPAAAGYVVWSLLAGTPGELRGTRLGALPPAAIVATLTLISGVSLLANAVALLDAARFRREMEARR